MDRLEIGTVVYCASRVAYGLALLAAPRAAARPWLGEQVERGATQVAARGLGVRDAALAAGAIAALARGADARPWLVACASGDLTDVGATALAGGELDRRSVRLTAALGGAYGATALGLAAALGRGR